jgi:phage anti-repressor protein
MNELIHINYESEKPAVSGRELHAALEVKTPYKDWFPRMCEYGFVENRDYLLVAQICATNNPKNPSTERADHALTLAMAKELCMLQRTAKGKECRQYFINAEESWNSPEKIMERAMQIAHARALEAERRIFALAETNESLEIALNTSLKFYTVAKYNKAYRKNWTLAQCQDIGKKLAGYCRAHAIEVRKCETNDERFRNVNSYPLTAWESFCAENDMPFN